jgi:hypothetical protein
MACAHTNEAHAYFLAGSLKKTSIMIIGDICDAWRFISLPYGDGCVSLPCSEMYAAACAYCRFTTPRRECNCDKITRPFIAHDDTILALHRFLIIWVTERNNAASCRREVHLHNECSITDTLEKCAIRKT